MATHIGRDGIVKIGGTSAKNDGTKIGQLRSFSVEETGDVVEYTVMGTSARTFLPTFTSFTGSAEAYWDEETATDNTFITVGSEITIKFFPEGDSATSPADLMYQGAAIVTSVTKSVSFDGMVEATFSFQGSGALTEYASVAP